MYTYVMYIYIYIILFHCTYHSAYTWVYTNVYLYFVNDMLFINSFMYLLVYSFMYL